MPVAVNKVIISNIMGLERLEIECGKVNTIKGDNGLGKTSVVSALQFLVGGGSIGTLLRDGQDKGQIVAVLDNGTQIVRKILPSGQSVEFLDEFGKKLPKTAGTPQEQLNSLASAIALNPVRFLNAKETDQLQMILDTFPSELDEEAVTKAVGGEEWRVLIPGIHDTKNACDHLEKTYFSRRTDKNSRRDQQVATIKQLRESLSGADADDATAELETVQAELKKLVEGERNHTAESIRNEQLDVRASDEKHDKIIADIQKKLDDARAAKAAARSDIQRKAEGERFDYSKTLAASRGELEKAQATLAMQRDQAVREASTKATITNLESQVKTLDTEIRQLTDQVEALRDLRKKAAEDIPIKGIENRDGKLYCDGLPFAAVNEARKVQVALQLARHAAGELPIICMDGLECLSPDTFAHFEKAVQKWDAQLFVTRVSNGPLRIVRDGEPDLFEEQ